MPKSYINNTNPMIEKSPIQQRADDIYAEGEQALTVKARRLGLKTDADGTIHMGSVVFTAIGLDVRAEIAMDEWREIGDTLKRLGDSIQWLIGDWVNGCQHIWGETYQEIVEATGYEYGTVRNYAVVAGAIELSRRRDNLSFSHHQNVAARSADEQDFWLEKAAVGKWTVAQMRAAMNPKPTPLLREDEQLAELRQARAEVVRKVAKLTANAATRDEALALVEEMLNYLQDVKQRWGG